MSTLAAPRARPAALSALAGSRLGRFGATTAPLTVAVATALCLVSFLARGGLTVEQATWVEVALVLGGALLCAAAFVLAPAQRRDWGVASVGAFGVLAILTVASIGWSVEPSDSWLEADRTFAYLATFAGAVALARLAPRRWAALPAGVLLASLVVSASALATHVFPDAIGGGDDTYARLRQPFDYWNAVGLMAAMGGPPALWLGSRRGGRPAVTALAYPIFALLVVTVLLSFSRGSILALVVGCGLWLACVPLRLRACAVALPAGAIGAGVAIWAFGQTALSEDGQPLTDRAIAGHSLGLLLLAAVVVAYLAGIAIGFLAARRPPTALTRQRAGVALLVALACVPVAVAGVLTFSHRGFTGSISHAWHGLVDPDAGTPDNSPGRLTATASVRARYWRDALSIWDNHELLGVGAGGYATARDRYRKDTLDVQHAHGYIVQTLADLGLLGLLASLALLAVWLAAALRATGLRRGDRGLPFDAPRIGAITLLAVVVAFGVHSFIDWTWFIPGTAVTALLCAGWLAGRGPLRRGEAAPASARTALPLPWRLVPAACILLAAVAVAYAVWQPLRSVHADNYALLALSQGQAGIALDAAQVATDRNPLSVDPYFTRAVILADSDRPQAAEQQLVDAVRLQPGNPETWLRLGELRYTQGDSEGAETALGRALALDPQSNEAVSVFLQAHRGAATDASSGRK